MSADNRICIMQGEDERWYVWDGSLSSYYYQPSCHNSLGCFETREKALEFAQKEAEGYAILEGGIEEISVEEQIQGLTYEIEDLASRLRLLTNRGSQWERNFN